MNQLCVNWNCSEKFIICDVCIVGETYSYQLYSEERQETDADKGLVLVETVHKGPAITGRPPNGGGTQE